MLGPAPADPPRGHLALRDRSVAAGQHLRAAPTCSAPCPRRRRWHLWRLPRSVPKLRGSHWCRRSACCRAPRPRTSEPGASPWAGLALQRPSRALGAGFGEQRSAPQHGEGSAGRQSAVGVRARSPSRQASWEGCCGINIPLSRGKIKLACRAQWGGKQTALSAPGSEQFM